LENRESHDHHKLPTGDGVSERGSDPRSDGLCRYFSGNEGGIQLRRSGSEIEVSS
jgi:hypothetical protein